MLQPREIDRVISAGRSVAQAAWRRRAQAQATPVPAPSSGQRRRVASLPSDPNGSGTGINPWWHYQEQGIPGGGRAIVNVGTGNLLLQYDDMSVPHKGVEMALRRTYNSQSGHDVNASDATGLVREPPGMYGNGWTNTFDAHLARNTDSSVYTIFDIDGARYDYDATWPANVPNGVYMPRAGNHAMLVYDGNCGYLWTKKSGTTYYFYRPGPHAPCPMLNGTTEGYAGRLYQIVGRNRNTFITFTYLWDNADASLTGKVASITAMAESGQSATLTFADVSGHRLLQQLTFPDGTTSVSYGYDANGNLTSVSRPPNNAAGIRPTELYGSQTVGTSPVIWYVASPRITPACALGDCYRDGGGFYFGFAGTSAATSTVSVLQDWADVNPPITDDGTAGGTIQSGYPSNVFAYNTEYYTTGVTTPTYRDTAGHMTNWVVDGTGRPTQTQRCTTTTNQGQQCVGSWLVSSQTWDAGNNLVSEIDERGHESDYAYDSHGNTVAAAGPPPTAGAARPTRLFTYDANDNVTAYCDPNATHAIGGDWTAPPVVPEPGQAALCPQSAVAVQYQWTSPTYEPFGEMTAMISPGTASAPLGYQRTISYDASRQGGVDYGLPTRVGGASITQSIDPSTPTRQPQQIYWYDANGNVVCSGTGSGQWLLTYDVLGRLTSSADPDDSSSGTGVCGKTGAQAGWNTTSRITYFPNGAVASKQSASQTANGIATTFTYDVDGNVKTETHHYGCLSVASCTAGVTTKWYDGADRLVEVQQPYDGSDIQQYPWSTRYIYDLSQGGVTSYRGMGLQGYGNLVSTQELLSCVVCAPPAFTTYQISTANWTDVRASTFDALDRPVSSYEAAFGDQPKVTNGYDGPGASGLVSWVRLGTNELKNFTYDDLGRSTDVSYANDGGATPAIHHAYDAAGNVTSRTAATLGTETISYDANGKITSVTEPPSLGGGMIRYGYYADGMRASAGYSDSIQSYPNAMQYGYRNDGKRERLILGNGTSFAWLYTTAGRLLTQSDPLTGTTVHPYVADDNGSHYYPGNVTYAPWTQVFDNYGRSSTITMPVTVFAFTGSQYDLEDGITQQTVNAALVNTGPPTGRFASAGVVCLRSTIRGEKPTNNGASPNCTPGAVSAINGTQLVGGAAHNDWNGGQPGWTVDARAGILLRTTFSGPPERMGSEYLYDASGRLIQDFEGSEQTVSGTKASPFNQEWCVAPLFGSTICYSSGTRMKSYDAENRIRNETFTYLSPTGSTPTSYGRARYSGYWDDTSGYRQPAQIQTVDYGTTSHPMRFTLSHPYLANTSLPPSETRAWLWDGSDRFIECWINNGQCQNPLLSVEGLADYDLAHGTLVRVNDRNRYGRVSMSRSAAAFSGFGDLPARKASRMYAPCSVDDTDQAPYGAGYDQAPCDKQHDGKLTADGWSLDYETWQGVRTFDSTIGQWNTPDAYAGTVHDPMSQKPFMWNRNNPYAYADPSGFETVAIFNSEAHTLRIIGITGTKDAGIDKTFAAANNVTHPDADPMKVNGGGHVPTGDWNLGAMMSVTNAEKPIYGNVGFIPLTDPVVGDKAGSRGVGIHSGRSGPEAVTEGCVRTTDAAMKFMKDHPPVLLEVDPPSGTPHMLLASEGKKDAESSSEASYMKMLDPDGEDRPFHSL